MNVICNMTQINIFYKIIIWDETFEAMLKLVLRMFATDGFTLQRP